MAGFPKFSITKDGKQRAVYKDGEVDTNDKRILGWVNTGVSVLAGSASDKANESHWVYAQPGDPKFFPAFIEKLLDEGYDVPVWVTRSLA